MTPIANLAMPLSRALLLCAIIGQPGNAIAGTREAMAEAMARMMETMGLLDPSPMTSMPSGASGWLPGLGGYGMPGAAPWGLPFQGAAGTMGKGGEMLEQLSKPMAGGTGGTGPFRWGGAPLEGIWEGRNGELLIVQGNRFRIYPGNAGYLDGYLQISGGRLAMYNPSDDSARPFEYAESEGRLVLRDASGQLLLYRRLWLNTPLAGEQAIAPVEK